MKDTVAILAGGGPASGINTVIASITKTFLNAGYRVLGVHEGYKGLLKTQETEDLSFTIADNIFNRGGSYLRMSRFKPKDTDFNTDIFVKNNVKLLVTIGGDDTASTANRISKFLASNDVKISNIHVPKTIDNDLPLPDSIPTFGYNTALNEGVLLGSTVYEDARTSANWFVLCAMGRSAGHLAFGIGAACHYPMIIVPEMFNKTTITVEKIINLMVSAIVKRNLLGIKYGAVIVSEGVFHELSDEEIKGTGIAFTFDDHGHPELGNVSKANVFNELLQKKLEALKIGVKSRPVELGYELRCCKPIGYDLVYCTQLGLGVKTLFDQGISGCMVMVKHNGDVAPLYLKDLENSVGKIPPRLVDINDGKTQGILKGNMHYITEADYEAAKSIVANPAEFDFNKILNW